MDQLKDEKIFLFKCKNPHPAGAIYKVIYTSKGNYIRETKRNVKMRWEEHLDINKISEPSRHLKNNSMNAFKW